MADQQVAVPFGEDQRPSPAPGPDHPPSRPTQTEGGNYPGGLALVGEKGPELINFNRGGHVFTAAETKKMLRADANNTRPMIINMNITTPDASSFRRSQSQIMAEANAAFALGRRNL